MSAPKHTPGPWRFEGRDIAALKAKLVCEVPGHGVFHAKVDTANAHLIAAAPELLTWLKWAMFVIDKEVEPATIRNTSQYESARAAIAKATGGQA